MSITEKTHSCFEKTSQISPLKEKELLMVLIVSIPGAKKDSAARIAFVLLNAIILLSKVSQLKIRQTMPFTSAIVRMV